MYCEVSYSLLPPPPRVIFNTETGPPSCSHPPLSRSTPHIWSRLSLSGCVFRHERLTPTSILKPSMKSHLSYNNCLAAAAAALQAAQPRTGSPRCTVNMADGGCDDRCQLVCVSLCVLCVRLGSSLDPPYFSTEMWSVGLKVWVVQDALKESGNTSMCY